MRLSILNQDGSLTRVNTPSYDADNQILYADVVGRTIYFGIPNTPEALANPEDFFKIKITWKPKFYLDIELECAYKGLVCGILGNFNDDVSDEWKLPEPAPYNGAIVPTPSYPRTEYAPSDPDWWNAQHLFGEAWKVGNMSCEAPPFPPDNSGCTEEQAAIYLSDDWCGKIATEPYSQCLTEDENIEDLIGACLYDMCMIPESMRVMELCNYLDDRETDCSARGTPIIISYNDRINNHLCPVECPSNMEYLEYPNMILQTIEDNCQDGEMILTGSPSSYPGCGCPEGLLLWNSVLQLCVGSEACILPVSDTESTTQASTTSSRTESTILSTTPTALATTSIETTTMPTITSSPTTTSIETTTIPTTTVGPCPLGRQPAWPYATAQILSTNQSIFFEDGLQYGGNKIYDSAILDSDFAIVLNSNSQNDIRISPFTNNDTDSLVLNNIYLSQYDSSDHELSSILESLNELVDNSSFVYNLTNAYLFTWEYIIDAVNESESETEDYVISQLALLHDADFSKIIEARRLYQPETIDLDIDLSSYKADIEILYDNESSECYSEFTVDDICDCLTVRDRTDYIDCETRHRDACEIALHPNSNPNATMTVVYHEGEVFALMTCPEGYHLVLIDDYTVTKVNDHEIHTECGDYDDDGQIRWADGQYTCRLEPECPLERQDPWSYDVSNELSIYQLISLGNHYDGIPYASNETNFLFAEIEPFGSILLNSDLLSSRSIRLTSFRYQDPEAIQNIYFNTYDSSNANLDQILENEAFDFYRNTITNAYLFTWVYSYDDNCDGITSQLALLFNEDKSLVLEARNLQQESNRDLTKFKASAELLDGWYVTECFREDNVEDNCGLLTVHDRSDYPSCVFEDDSTTAALFSGLISMYYCSINQDNIRIFSMIIQSFFFKFNF